MEEKNKIQKGVLYLVGTPIGNLADISERAKKTLTEVDFIAAEDTRNSQKLLFALGIKNELVSYHEHNKRESGERILRRLLNNESCALITDAGMPAISDPGEDLCRLCAENGVCVSVVPGPSAVVSALALSALSTRRFAFEGFLPPKETERKRALTALSKEERTLVFYEAPHRLLKTLCDMRDAFGEARKISLCREITKLNESVLRLNLSEACEYYEKNEPRGEFVLVISGYEGAQNEEAKDPLEEIDEYIEMGENKMDAIKRVARERKIPKSELYKAYTERKENEND